MRKPAEKKRTIRLSQTVSPFGTGAIYDLVGESFAACDTYRWKEKGRELRLDRLARALGVTVFREAPTAPDFFSTAPADRLPFHRFPEWVFCSDCRRMRQLHPSGAVDTPRCTCPEKPRLVPMRFVMVCSDGHLGDVNWWLWAHSGVRPEARVRCERYDESLRFNVLPDAGGGLASLVVEAACGAGRSLDRITGEEALHRAGIKCTGVQPWQRRGASPCDAPPRAVQRGASNLHFPRVASALDIPPDSDFRPSLSLDEAIEVHPLFGRALAAVADDGKLNMVGRNVRGVIADDLEEEGGTEDDVERVVLARWRADRGLPASGPGSVDDGEDIEFSEFLAFTTERELQYEESKFITEHVDVLGPGDLSDGIAGLLEELITGVVLAPRLREVRALTGFTRIKPSGSVGSKSRPVKLVTPSLGRTIQWLPAVEVFGEGIFLRFSESALSAWESDPAVQRRMTRTSALAKAIDWLPEATPRFAALHTLAHLLIRQLTFECGYSSASLREKVYARAPGSDTEPMAGILIYTAAGDAEGSLGGIVRQGQPPRMARTILAALESAAWCSSDPICAETRSGPDAINTGACHACALVAETSCNCGNLLLDRVLLVGSDTTPGLFQPLLQRAVSEAAGGDPS